MFSHELDRLPHVFVPVRPVVAAGEFLVHVLDMELLEVCVKVAIGLKQRIVPAAVDADAQRLSAFGEPLSQRKAAAISAYVKKNAVALIKQLEDIPLQNRDQDTWGAFVSNARQGRALRAVIERESSTPPPPQASLV